jgi:hypothetical protein
MPATRRDFLAASAALAAGRPPIPAGKADACIFLWLGGGMSQADTFDPKHLGDPATRKAGSAYPSIPTAVPGVRVCEHLPRTAALMDRVTAVRTVHHDVIDEHAAATLRVHTGRPTAGTVQYPSVGSVVAHLKGPAAGLPPYVLVGYPNVARGPGFLGPACGPVYLTDLNAGPAGLSRPADVDADRAAARQKLLAPLRASAATAAPVAAYDQAVGQSQRLAGGDFLKLFDLSAEPAAVRESYGGEFGQRCLLARRLTAAGVRFVEVSHNLNFLNGTGWDTHFEGQKNQHLLIRELDAALAGLLADLERVGRLDRTLVVVATEFGRPLGFDAKGGRGHQGSAFTLVLAGGGLRHRGAYGTTDDACKKPADRPVSVPDFHATVYAALGLDWARHLDGSGRPVPVTDGGRPLADLLPTA